LIRALLFDLDETLLDRDASLRAFLARQYTRFATALAAVPFADYEARFLLHDEYGYVAKEIVYQQLVTEFGLALDSTSLVEDFYIDSWQSGILFADTIALLQQAQQAGYRIAIVTNGAVRTQMPKITNTALAHLVDQVLISEAEGVRKPDAEIFRRAAQRLGVAPDECIMIGDNPQADVWGALQVGMQAIWLQGYLPWPADLPAHSGRTVATIGALLGCDWQQLSKP